MQCLAPPTQSCIASRPGSESPESSNSPVSLRAKIFSTASRHNSWISISMAKQGQNPQMMNEVVFDHHADATPHSVQRTGLFELHHSSDPTHSARCQHQPLPQPQSYACNVAVGLTAQQSRTELQGQVQGCVRNPIGPDRRTFIKQADKRMNRPAPTSMRMQPDRTRSAYVYQASTLDKTHAPTSSHQLASDCFICADQHASVYRKPIRNLAHICIYAVLLLCPRRRQFDTLTQRQC